MKEFTASSGAKVQIGYAAWDNFNLLQAAVLREVAKTGLDLKGLKLSTDINIGGLLSTFCNSFLMIASSPEVYAALWPCLEKSTYNGHKITKAVFEDMKARQDYYEILKEFITFNVTPFLSPRVIEFWEKLKTMQSDTQKLK